MLPFLRSMIDSPKQRRKSRHAVGRRQTSPSEAAPDRRGPSHAPMENAASDGGFASNRPQRQRMMKTSHFLIILAAISISTLYAPQPLLPIFRQQLGVSETTASLLITVTMLPLGLAPLLYGYFLESFSSKKMMAGALILLAATEIAIGFCTSYPPLLILRLCQGLIIPAMLTSIMTYLSGSAPADAVRRVMAIYIATTTVGGFSGRFFTGLLAEFFSWRVPFFCLGASLAVAALLIRTLPPDTRPAFKRVPLAAIPEVLKKPGFLKIYGLAFCFFFVFAATLNYLPFRLAQISGGYSASRTGAMYLGYLMGISSSLLSMRTVRLLGGEVRAIAAGIGVMFLSVVLFAVPSQIALFFSLFVLCAGMFLSHSVAPGAINSCSGEKKGLVNGLYISFYYSGGALGSYLPSVIQAHFGWSAFLGSLFFFLSLALCLALTLKAQSFQGPSEHPTPAHHVHH